MDVLPAVGLEKCRLDRASLRRADRAAAIGLVAEGFDMLEEDLDKERFFAFVRRSYWGSGDAAATRALMQSLIGSLDF